MSEKTIVIRRARLPFVQLRRGLIDAKHRETMGTAIWLYLYFHDVADRKQGIAIADLAGAAAQLGLSDRAVRKMYGALIDGGYLEPLTLEFETATAADRLAKRSPFVRIARYSDGSRTRKMSSGTRNDCSGTWNGCSGTRNGMVDAPNRIARASEEALEALDAVDVCAPARESSPPLPADEAETRPVPNATQCAQHNGQSNGNRNGHVPHVAESVDDTPFTPTGSYGPPEFEMNRRPGEDVCDSEEWQRIEHEIVHGGWCPRWHRAAERRLKSECYAEYRLNPDPELWWSWLRADRGINGEPIASKPGYFAKVIVPRIEERKRYEPRGAPAKPATPVDPSAPKSNAFSGNAFFQAACALHAQGEPWEHLTKTGQLHSAEHSTQEVRHGA